MTPGRAMERYQIMKVGTGMLCGVVIAMHVPVIHPIAITAREVFIVTATGQGRRGRTNSSVC